MPLVCVSDAGYGSREGAAVYLQRKKYKHSQTSFGQVEKNFVMWYSIIEKCGIPKFIRYGLIILNMNLRRTRNA